MLSTYILRVLVRDLEGLRSEIEAYPSSDQLWELPPGISNSGGTLALHLVGNLRHFIGAVIGGSGYERDRPGEFQDRDLPKSEVSALIDPTIEEISKTLDGLTDQDLSAAYPVEVGGVRLDTGQFLVHLAGHFSYHLGQVNYHRRLISGVNQPVVGNQMLALESSPR